MQLMRGNWIRMSFRVEEIDGAKPATHKLAGRWPRNDPGSPVKGFLGLADPAFP